MPDTPHIFTPSAADLEIQDELASTADLSGAADLFAVCRRRIGRFLDEQMEALFKRAHDDLFAEARDAGSDDLQHGCFDAMQELHRVKPAIRTGFSAAVLGALDRLWAAEVAAETTGEEPDIDADHLSLVDTQSMEDEIQIAKIVTRAAADLRSGEYALERRWSEIFPVPVDAESDPVNVRNVCEAFHEAVQNLGAAKTSRRALFRAFEATLIRNLGKLHQELNDLLVARGIAPKIRYEQPRRTERPGRTGPEAVTAGAREKAPETDAAPAREATARAKRAAPAPIWAAEGDATLSIPFAGAYGAVQRLMALERALAAGAAAVPAAGPPTPDERQRVEAALARVQQSGEAADWGEKGPYAFGIRIRTALARHGIDLRDSAVGDVIDMVATMLEHILRDPLVQASARPAIRRLGVPLARAALADATFLASDVHPARVTINRLGRLCVPGPSDAGEAPFQAAEVDAVVARLLAAPRADQGTFAQAAQTLDGLLARQRDRYEQGVAQLVESLDREQHRLAARRKADAAGEPALSAAEAAHESWQRALDAVARVQIGDVLILGAGSVTPVPASLVWRSGDGNLLAVADALGRHAGSFMRRELAMVLRRGAAHLDETALMPIVDRAMCAVLEDLHGRLEHKANRDPLTGLANRKRYVAELERAMKAPPAAERNHHACVLGLPHLPEIAKRVGQRPAHTLIRRYAPLIERQVGDKGLVAHLGGGKFALLLENSTRNDVLQLMERHRRSIELSKCTYRGEPLDMAVSIGVVTIATGASDPEEILAAAGTAYDTARAGSPMGLHVQETLAGAAPAAADVAALIAAGRLALRCQRVAPVDSASGLQPYYEVLLGIRSADGEVCPPGELIVAAEAAGQIPDLDRWVVAEALRWMAVNDARLASVKGVAINLSGGTLSDPKLAQFVAGEIESAGVQPGRIMFEVTESAAIERLSTAREFIETMRALGCRFALDDFGAGHASFSYLKLLPVDTVKIDGMFVKDIASSPADEAMVRSINEVAKLLGKTTVAEFVENAEALARLRALGVDYAQGYGIERPMSIDALLK
jgi:diguanylate cyclase (GGDEF)-like protein